MTKCSKCDADFDENDKHALVVDITIKPDPPKTYKLCGACHEEIEIALPGVFD